MPASPKLRSVIELRATHRIVLGRATCLAVVIAGLVLLVPSWAAAAIPGSFHTWQVVPDPLQSRAQRIDLSSTSTGFVGKLEDPAAADAAGRSYWATAATVSASQPLACSGGPPTLPAGTVVVTGTHRTDGRWDLTFPFGQLHLDVVAPDATETACSLIPVRAGPYRLETYARARRLWPHIFDRFAVSAAISGTPGLLVLDPSSYSYPDHAAGSPVEGELPCPAGACLGLPLANFFVWGDVDSDGDGLPDSWERDGVRVAGQRVDLPGMGARADHKDLFLELDRIDGAAVSSAVLSAMAHNFASAPVSNPDHRTGITLHLDAGRSSVMDPPSGRTWGTRSRSDLLSAGFVLGGFSGGADGCDLYDWSPFTALREAHFDAARRPVFRYAIAAQTIGACASGNTADIPGSDFVFQTISETPGNPPISDRGVLGTFMHELGHALGLEHGGNEDVNWKPDYLSVMNYLYQFSGVVHTSGARDSTYSSETDPAARAIDEHAIDEGHALPNAAPAGVRLSSRCPGGGDEPDVQWFLPGDPVDLHCSGAPAPGVGPFDLNGDGTVGTLTTENDWTHLSFAGGQVGALGRPEPRSGRRPASDPITRTQETALIRSSMQDATPPTLSVTVRGRRITVRTRDDVALNAVVVRAGRLRLIRRAPLNRDTRAATFSFRVPGHSRKAVVTTGDQAQRYATATVALPR